MMMLLTLSFLWTLPLALVVLSWVGAKLGARAPLIVFLPFPLFVAALSRFLTGGLDAVVEAATMTMDSVPMAFSWAIPYFHLSRLVDRRVSNPTWASGITAILAIAIAYVVQQLYAPAWALVEGPVPQLVAVLLVITASAGLLWLPKDERAVVSAVPTPMALIARVLGMFAIIFGLVWGHILPGWAGAILLAVLHSFPRLTFEMALSFHATNGVRASRQLLAGLPLAVTMAVVWCFSLIFLRGVLPDAALLPIAGGLTLAWWAVLLVGYVRKFGVFRRKNGFF